MDLGRGRHAEIAGFLLRLVGEPFLSAFTADQMRTLLARFGFTVVQDDDLATIATSLSAEFADASMFLKDMRIVTAQRR